MGFLPLTMLQVYDNCVVDFTINESKGFDNILIAFNKAEKGEKYF